MFTATPIGRSTTNSGRFLKLSVGESISWMVTRNKVNQTVRESRFLKKMIVGRGKRKKPFSMDQAVPRSLAEISQIGKSVAGGVPLKSNKSQRRVEVLNTLFMEQITSLMSTGDVTPELMGQGIMVSKVKMSHDFSKVNVYWVASGTEKDLVLEPMLEKSGYALRHALTQLRVIGMVPPIEFVKDKTFSKIMEVQTLLEKCDFGEDFVPTSPSNYFTQTHLNSRSTKFGSPHIESDDSSDEIDKSTQDEAKTETDLYTSQPFRQDILGVRYDVISAEIKECVTKSRRCRAIKQPENAATLTSAENYNGINEQPAPIMSAASSRQEDLADENRRNDFMKYLRQRSILKAKELKRNTTAEKEKDFYDNERFERWKKSVNIEFHDDIDEKDDYSDEEYSSRS